MNPANPSNALGAKASKTGPLQILHLEDKPRDHELVSAHLKAHGFEFKITQARTRGEFVRAVDEESFNLILSDYTLPAFSGAAALELVREAAPATPFIFVSGTIGEERAVESMKSGATDYVLKDHLDRLGLVVERALRETQAKTERQLAEEQLHEMRARMDRVLAHSPAVIYSMAIEGDALTPSFITANLLPRWGYAVEEALHPDWWSIHVHPDDRQSASANLAQLLAHGTIHQEYRFRRKGGDYRWIEDQQSLIRDAEGKPTEIAGVWTDVTEKKLLETQVLRSQRVESIGTLAGGIAHDLNNVLSPIMMSIDLLKMKAQDDEALAILASVESSAQRGAKMVRQVLSFARGMDGERMAVKVSPLIDEVTKIVKDSFPKNIRIEQHLANRLWSLKADPTQLHQVLLNLCVNARDAMPQGGTLTLSAQNIFIDEPYAAKKIHARAGPHLKIEVKDTGTGIPPAIIDRIFDPFFTTKDFGKGTGLGLSTSLAIVKSHGGFIELESDTHLGTSFAIFLPVDDVVDPSLPPPNGQERPRGNGETILLVDDEAIVRDVTAQILKTFGYNVELASNGAEAVALYQTQRENIAAVLTDVMMPVMDGRAMVQLLRRFDPHLKIIAASGVDHDDEMSAEGIKCFLPKPYNTRTLLTSLRMVLDATD